ncbi:MAG: hypothetical protein HYT49_02845 [Candidatus Wildermuthbacteria bacterium]|nr:hypothetical protein [Candidatus Wildermuthbacteria bacterium]
MLTAILLAIGVGVSGITVSQLQQLRGLGDSVFAFGAADAGAERGLYVDRVECNAIEPVPANVPDVFDCVNSNLPVGGQALPNESEYELELKPDTDPDCPGDYYCIESKGQFQRTLATPASIRNVQTDR